jgi:isoprenylcysteine carboxyl methyltransferase (ICMT) family protein YpbQ
MFSKELLILSNEIKTMTICSLGAWWNVAIVMKSSTQI